MLLPYILMVCFAFFICLSFKGCSGGQHVQWMWLIWMCWIMFLLFWMLDAMFSLKQNSIVFVFTTPPPRYLIRRFCKVYLICPFFLGSMQSAYLPNTKVDTVVGANNPSQVGVMSGISTLKWLCLLHKPFFCDWLVLFLLCPKKNISEKPK